MKLRKGWEESYLAKQQLAALADKDGSISTMRACQSEMQIMTHNALLETDDVCQFVLQNVLTTI